METFYGYLMDKNQTYRNSTPIKTEEELSNFIKENVPKHYEIRITDKDDALVLHVVNQTLIFPIPEHGETNNKWDDEQKRFRTVRK